jgi:hypothetical protein
MADSVYDKCEDKISSHTIAGRVKENLIQKGMPHVLLSHFYVAITHLS